MKLTIALLTCLLSLPAIAEETTTNQKVSAMLSGTCQFVVSNVAFGEYNPLDTFHKQATQNINLHCSKGLNYQIMTFGMGKALILGNGEAATAMTSATTDDKLYYQVFEEQNTYNGSNGNVWDDDMNVPQQAQYGTGTGMTQNISFLYRILKNQKVSPANYSATQIMTIKF